MVRLKRPTSVVGWRENKLPSIMSSIRTSWLTVREEKSSMLLHSERKAKAI